MIDFLYLTIGLVLLVWGGNLLLSYSILFGRLIRLSTIWISIVIISFGTSAPELVVSLNAAAQSLPAIAIGNVIGSNIANTLLVLGLAALIQPVEIRFNELKVENSLLAGAFLFLCIFIFTGTLNFAFGLVCMFLLVGYLWYSYRSHKIHEMDEEVIPCTRLKAFSLCVLGLLLLIGGAEFLVKGAVGIARFLDVSEEIISLSMVAVGTSLPEMVTSMFAACKGKSYITLANVVGSNLFNIMVVLGFTALIFPLAVGSHFLKVDIWVMGALTFLLFLITFFLKKIGRILGAALLLTYAVYITYIYVDEHPTEPGFHNSSE